jgi:hypothetical protein
MAGLVCAAKVVLASCVSLLGGQAYPMEPLGGVQRDPVAIAIETAKGELGLGIAFLCGLVDQFGPSGRNLEIFIVAFGQKLKDLLGIGIALLRRLTEQLVRLEPVFSDSLSLPVHARQSAQGNVIALIGGETEQLERLGEVLGNSFAELKHVP